MCCKEALCLSWQPEPVLDPFSSSRRPVTALNFVVEALGGFGISARLNENIEHVAVGVYCAPEPMLHAIDRNHDLIEVPLVIRPWPVAADATGKMRAEGKEYVVQDGDVMHFRFNV